MDMDRHGFKGGLVGAGGGWPPESPIYRGFSGGLGGGLSPHQPPLKSVPGYASLWLMVALR